MVGNSTAVESAERADPAKPLGVTSGMLRLAVLVARLLNGMAGASHLTLSLQLIANVAAPGDRPHYSGLLAECTMIGIGSGPVVKQSNQIQSEGKLTEKH